MSHSYSSWAGISGQVVSSISICQPLSSANTPGPVSSRRENDGGMASAGQITRFSYSRQANRPSGRFRLAEGGSPVASSMIWSMCTAETWKRPALASSCFTARAAMGWGRSAREAAWMETLPSSTKASQVTLSAMSCSSSRSSRRWTRLADKVETKAGFKSFITGRIACRIRLRANFVSWLELSSTWGMFSWAK